MSITGSSEYGGPMPVWLLPPAGVTFKEIFPNRQVLSDVDTTSDWRAGGGTIYAVDSNNEIWMNGPAELMNTTYILAAANSYYRTPYWEKLKNDPGVDYFSRKPTCMVATTAAAVTTNLDIYDHVVFDTVSLNLGDSLSLDTTSTYSSFSVSIQAALGEIAIPANVPCQITCTLGDVSGAASYRLYMRNPTTTSEVGYYGTKTTTSTGNLITAVVKPSNDAFIRVVFQSTSLTSYSNSTDMRAYIEVRELH